MSARLRVLALAAGGAALLAADRIPHEPLAAHMLQHALVAAVAAPLVALAAPVGLLLRTLRRPARRRLLAVLRSRPLAVVTHPLLAWPAFVALVWALHVDPLLTLALERPLVHALEHGALAVTAILFWLPVVGRNPVARPLRGGERAAYLIAAVPAVDLAALYFMASARPAAGTAMLAGMAPLPLAAMAVTWDWLRREDERRARWEAYVDA